MAYETLKRDVREANQNLYNLGLVKLTFGNVSARAPDGNILIKPSGVNFSALRDGDVVVVSPRGDVIECDSKNSRPSVDLSTHLRIYRSFDEVGAVVHTHSPYSAGFAQACIPIPCTGTTHADFFNGNVPVARLLSEEEVSSDYEGNTGKAIVETFTSGDIHPLDVPACLVPYHGAFVWGSNVHDAMKTALILEEVAKMESVRRTIAPGDVDGRIPDYLLRKHFVRKHGRKGEGYYGQGSGTK